mmetsp:Transcript_21561/g.52108  ORF Transcript_21561/g.52108 Transcript_21561/m.52108 type:complete len:238 (+) Transcript_21561:1380-2093(+)
MLQEVEALTIGVKLSDGCEVSTDSLSSFTVASSSSYFVSSSMGPSRSACLVASAANLSLCKRLALASASRRVPFCVKRCSVRTPSCFARVSISDCLATFADNLACFNRPASACASDNLRASSSSLFCLANVLSCSISSISRRLNSACDSASAANFSRSNRSVSANNFSCSSRADSSLLSCSNRSSCFSASPAKFSCSNCSFSTAALSRFTALAAARSFSGSNWPAAECLSALTANLS